MSDSTISAPAAGVRLEAHRGRSEHTLWSAVAAIGLLIICVGTFMLVAAPAQAARDIKPPANYSCGNYHTRTISITPPRIWSSYHRPEQVGWGNQIERWSSVRKEWYTYSRQFFTFASFNWYGRSDTSWSGIHYVNSKLHLQAVTHPGYYRVASAIRGNQGGVQWGGYIGGDGAYCYMR